MADTLDDERLAWVDQNRSGQLRQDAAQGGSTPRADPLGQSDEHSTDADGRDVGAEHAGTGRAVVVAGDREHLVTGELSTAEQGEQADSGVAPCRGGGPDDGDEQREAEQQQHRGRVRETTPGTTVRSDRQGGRDGTRSDAPDAGSAALIWAPIHGVQPTQTES